MEKKEAAGKLSFYGLGFLLLLFFVISFVLWQSAQRELSQLQVEYTAAQNRVFLNIEEATAEDYQRLRDTSERYWDTHNRINSRRFSKHVEVTVYTTGIGLFLWVAVFFGRGIVWLLKKTK